MTLKVPEFARMEIKFIARRIHYHSMLHWLRINKAGFITNYPNRWVNNIYFDNHMYAAYMENLSGASSRTKVRYRWYGESDTPDAGLLEVKRKRNYFGWKLQFQVNKAPYENGASWSKIKQMISTQLPPQGKIWLETNPLPVLINRYYRHYLISRDNNIRVTVDSRQSFLRQHFKPHPNFIHQEHFADKIVVEFKFTRKVSRIVSLILEDIPIRVSKHSKYITGIRATHGLKDV